MRTVTDSNVSLAVRSKSGCDRWQPLRKGILIAAVTDGLKASVKRSARCSRHPLKQRIDVYESRISAIVWGHTARDSGILAS
jgi:hypothetical protein